MLRAALLFGGLMASSATRADAVLEVEGIFGECMAVHSAVNDHLELHHEPKLSSATQVIPYREGWRVPFLKREGKTQIMRLGLIEIKKPGADFMCSMAKPFPEKEMSVGDKVEYLHYLGEGYARVRIDSLVCDAFIDDSSEYLEVLRQPEITTWIRVIYFDGSSPGWLLNDRTQTKVVGVEC